MARYKIIQDVIVKCRIIAVDFHINKILVQYGDYETGEYLFKFFRNTKLMSFYEDEMNKQKVHTIHRVTLESNVGVYHKYTWDDVYKGICHRCHIGEIQKEKGTREPIVFRYVDLYENFDGRHIMIAKEQFNKDYIEIDSPNAQYALEYINPKNHNAIYMRDLKQREKEEEEQEDAYYAMMDAYEDHKWDRMDMTEEDRIMDALENGDADIYGF